MALFRDTVASLEDKEIYILLDGKPVKVKITNIVDDMVKITITDGSQGATEIAMHVNNLIFVTA